MQSNNYKVPFRHCVYVIETIILEEYRNGGKGKKGSKQSTVKQLMEKTRSRRQQWIRSDHPLVSEVITTFPHLASSRWVSIMYAFIIKS